MGQLVELVEWIANVTDKRKEFRRLKRKNLMVQAVLTSTLIKATSELRMEIQRF
jgi:signal recognition particle subunit SEC65